MSSPKIFDGGKPRSADPGSERQGAVRVSLPIVEEARAATETESTAVRKYWRSIAEKEGSRSLAAAAAREFPAGAGDLPDPNRRVFMQLLGSSAALAGVAACHQPQEQTVPFVRRPEEVTPGLPLHFATGYSLEGFSTGLLVQSYEGRPTKIEGNPEHRDSLGAARACEQALLLGLYDDDRAKQIRHKGDAIAWRQFLGQVAVLSARHAVDGGARLRFLADPTASPLLSELRSRLLVKFPNAKFVSFSPVASDGTADGLRAAYGRPVEARHDLTRAAVILSLDSDFLGDGPGQLRLSRQFATRRVPGAGMNRLYVVEPALSITGMSADHRLRLRAGDVADFAQSVAAELGGRSGFSQLANIGGAGRAAGAVDAKWVRAVAADLAANRGRSLVIAGRRQPAAIHALAAALNAALDNVGVTVSYAAPLLTDARAGSAPLTTLAQEIAAGQVDTLVVTARNPAYSAPADLKFDKLLSRVPTTIYHSLYEDETAPFCTYFVPAAHPLESWGDGRATDGTITITQPLIAPLWGGITDVEILGAFLGEGDQGAYKLLRQSWKDKMASIPGAVGDPDHLWEKWLADGVIVGTETSPLADLTLDLAVVTREIQAHNTAAPKGAGIEIVFATDYKVFDGRFANAAWLQELPDPVTKITWDNAALMSPTTAKALGVEVERDGDKLSILAIEYRDRRIHAPVMIAPGHADDCITLPLGYGRAGSEKVARGVGFNAGALRTSEAPWFDRGAQVSLATGMHLFGVTQNHWSDEGREPAMEVSLADLQNEHSHFHEHIEERRGVLPTIHRPVDYSKVQYKWGMAIDLSKCTGCSACVVACQAENNIPVVGKENVVLGREMQWLRIDRYYRGEIENPEVVIQPLGCVHCETAPCEYVCPVNATVHSDEGLNEMVYNRCIGTRYCSNNCPYKVRRFNFLDYTSETPAVRRMGMNPEVTVRSRGIMEKCTYCVQRIEQARIETRIQKTAIKDDLQTACQQGCPSDAIVFGNLNDPQARVSKLHADARRYDLLHELGTRPRTAYLARVRNPNPELAKG
ncbi:MAG: TAT-variant-translocated molybdopterin oxidoreductase [Deltaproteobacteria bacterium]|nr:TAT-variant-translocated molybdopterin oxidoreductase [Deltaproteobacteria bacterium]